MGEVHGRVIRVHQVKARRRRAPVGEAAPAGAPAVRVAGLTKRFGPVCALDDVTLELPAGRLVTLLGPSGCGKTTLLRILAGFEQPDAGTVEIGGEDMQRRPPERRPVNMVFQRYALFPHRNVLENVLFGLQSSGTPAKAAREQALATLALCRMDGYEERRIDELSGGQAQRVAVARALVNRPRVLLLDEPLAALDLKLRRHMQVELRRLQQELGMTFVYVTHDQDEALAMSDLIVLLDAGRPVQCAAPRDLYDAPACVFAATFLGEANVLPGVLAADDGRVARVAVGDLELPARSRPGLSPGAAVHLCVRPERVLVAEEEGSGAGTPATLLEVVFRGASVRYLLRVDGTALRVVADVAVRPGAPLLEAGAPVRFAWDGADAATLLDA